MGQRIGESNIKFADSAAIDAYGRLRISNPKTIFDSKQIFDNQPLFWDERLESGGGIAAAHSVDEASTVITSTVSTAGVFTRQTFMRFNYEPGKSQQIIMTGVLDLSGGGTGVERRIGLFDDNNGLFWEDDAGTIGVTIRSNVTGSAVDTTVVQDDWNIDKMDGTGQSQITIDFSKAQLFYIDYEWLSIGRIRFCLLIDGVAFGIHEVNNANSITLPYMSTPNLPLRYQMVTTSSSPASTMRAICTTVISEGGQQGLGVIRSASTGGTHVAAAADNTVYAIVGIRLKTTHVAATIQLLSASIAETVGDKDFEVLLLWNPTVADTFTYSDETNSAIQAARGAVLNVVTNGIQLGVSFQSSAKKGGSADFGLSNALRLGSAINGDRDTLVLCVRPIGGDTSLQIEGAIVWRELS